MNELMRRNLELLEQLEKQDKLLASVPVEAIRVLISAEWIKNEADYIRDNITVMAYDDVRAWLDSLEQPK